MQILNTKPPTELNEIAAFDVTGENAASFLQGQLTQDVNVWQANEIKRAAWCNVKGRMQATFYIWQIEGGFRLLIARDLVAKVLPRLRMFVMRAKVKVSEPLDMALFACTSTLPALSHDSQVFALLDQYGVTFSSESTSHAITTAWTTAHTQAGVAWVSAVNSEQFVPQTANYELVGGVNFRKGCYPGQEIVARSQYLGKLKQRAAIALVVGKAAVLQDIFQQNIPNPVGKIIQSSQGDTGCTVLFEAPHALIENHVTLTLGKETGAVLHIQPLPYLVRDITA
jgi:tRNA-modifying protein YgfZ